MMLYINWSELFTLETPLVELLVRGTILYVGLLLLMRLMPRRTGAELNLMDLIWVLLVAEAASHSMGDYTSILDGIVLIVVYMLWDYIINFLSYHVPAIERVLSPPPLLIIKEGRLLKRNMRKEFLTEEELMSYLRAEGIEDVKEVKKAYVEPEGEITAITYEKI